MATADICARYVPMVYGGQLDPWTVVDGRRVRLTTWPCPGHVDAGILTVTCDCPCHSGGEPHILPKHVYPDATPRRRTHGRPPHRARAAR